jgi:hypothetical protein
VLHGKETQKEQINEDRVDNRGLRPVVNGFRNENTANETGGIRERPQKKKVGDYAIKENQSFLHIPPREFVNA